MNYGCYHTTVRAEYGGWHANRYQKQIVAWLSDGDYRLEIRKNVPDDVTASVKLQEELLAQLKRIWVSRQVD